MKAPDLIFRFHPEGSRTSLLSSRPRNTVTVTIASQEHDTACYRISSVCLAPSHSQARDGNALHSWIAGNPHFIHRRVALIYLLSFVWKRVRFDNNRVPPNLLTGLSRCLRQGHPSVMLQRSRTTMGTMSKTGARQRQRQRHGQRQGG